MRTIRNSGIIILLGLLFWGCGSQNEAEQVIRKVKLETVQPADTLEIRTFPGRVREVAELNLAFRVAGPISNIAVREGDYVRAGQLIAEMDQRDYQIQLNAAQAKYEQVKAEAERVIELYNRQSVAVNDYDKAVSGLKMVEANLEHARAQLNDTRLLAPVSGFIQRVNFRRNELVDAGMPVVSLLDVSRYQVEVDVPVSIYASRDDILSFTAVQSVLGDASFDLRLLGINRKASQNQLYRLNLAVDNISDADLAPGMDVQVNILLRNNIHLRNNNNTFPGII
jgi:RND family efflux transporter MFP subunit